MASPNPAVSVKDGANSPQTVVPFDVTAANVVVVALASTAGVNSWGFTLYGQDESVSPPAVTIDNTLKTATFTAPAAPWTLIYKSVVNGGVDINGVTQASYTTTVGIHCLTSNGFRLGASNESLESNTTVGWVSKVNAKIKDGAAGLTTIGAIVSYGTTAAPVISYPPFLVQTTNATLTTIANIPLSDNSIYDFVSTTIGRNTANNGDAYRGDVLVTYQRFGAAAPSLVGAAGAAANVRTAGAVFPGISVAVSGNSLLFQVTGVAATTINWTCTIQIQERIS